MTSTSSTDGAGSRHLPYIALLALTMTGFTAIITETLPAGLLLNISTGLDVSEAAAGQLVTLYAIGALVAAIPAISLTQSWNRKTALLVALGGFVVFNTLTAISTNYYLTLVARFFAGASSGLGWGLLPGYARHLVVQRQEGRALTLALAGIPIALAIGVPLGTFLGDLFGWRAAFLLVSLSTTGLMAWVVFFVPSKEGTKGTALHRLRSVLTTPGIIPILFTVLVWMTAHNLLYIYIAPFANRAGLAEWVDALLLTFGVAALASVWMTGLLIDRMLRLLVLAGLGLFAVVSIVLISGGDFPVVLTISTVAWGLSFAGASAVLNTAAADAAGDGIDLASAAMATSWNCAISAGGLIGGLLVSGVGVAAIPWTMLAFLLCGLATSFLADKHAFPSGRR